MSGRGRSGGGGGARRSKGGGHLLAGDALQPLRREEVLAHPLHERLLALAVGHELIDGVHLLLPRRRVRVDVGEDACEGRGGEEGGSVRGEAEGSGAGSAEEARYVFAPAMCEIADAHAIAPMSWAMIETANSDGVTGVMSP